MRSRAVLRGTVHLAVQGLVVAALVVASAAPAVAAKPTGGGSHGGGGKGGGGGGTTSLTGNDVSYPQCGSSLPSSPAFAIVGVNGGLADDLNPCLGPSSSYPSYTESELYWAETSTTGGTSQPDVSLYVNTADPGSSYNGTPVADWPTSGGSPSAGTCTTTKPTSTGCAWQYGYNMATQDVAWLTGTATVIDTAINGTGSTGPVPTTASGYPWWLDVETANTWQTGTLGVSMNIADLQGMIAGLEAEGVTTVGVYSTSAQWGTITGGTTTLSTDPSGAKPPPVWLPGARTSSGAAANCSQASFTGGPVTVTQWFGHPVDGDYACTQPPP